MSLKGQIAVVVGGARGTGRACVESLLQKQVKVCFGDLTESRGEDVHAELSAKHGENNVLYRQCDISKDDDVKALFELAYSTWKSINIVINVAGYIDEFDHGKCIDINLKGCIMCCKTALHYMGKNNGGSGGVVVIMSSISGLQPEWWGPVYAATKHAIVGYTRSLGTAEQFDLHGVRVNCVCAGNIHSGFVTELMVHKRIHFAEKMTSELPDSIRKTPAEMSESFLQLIEDTSLNGRALIVSNNHGTLYATFHTERFF